MVGPNGFEPSTSSVSGHLFSSLNNIRDHREPPNKTMNRWPSKVSSEAASQGLRSCRSSLILSAWKLANVRLFVALNGYFHDRRSTTEVLRVTVIGSGNGMLPDRE